jgi:hypothetical protein
MTVRGLEREVEAFNHLFKRTKFCRNRIIVGKADDLSDVKMKGAIF